MPSAAKIERAVRLGKKWNVVPARASVPQQCRLCSSDLQMLGCNYIQKGLVYSMAGGAFDFRKVVKLLKKSLSDALVYFYPLAGRLTSSSDGVVVIDCNDRGADFIEAAADGVGISEIMEKKIGAPVRELFALDGAINTNGQFLPLLVVQATKLRDGIAVSFTVNHAILDGTALWHFINCWAQMCRESSASIIDLPPLHTRCFTTGLPIKLNLHNPRIECLSTFTPPKLSEKLFHFTAETISRLKQQANKTTSKDKPISSFQALSAHIWRGITKARGLSPSELTTFKLAINCRPRIVPPLPYSYFGNAIQFASATISAGELLDMSTPCVARILHNIISAHQDGNIRAELEKPPTIVQLDKSSPENTVMMGSSPRFPMYENDFGWGRPIGVRSGWANKFDGKMSSYPGCDDSGSVDIEICLLPKTMSALDSDPHFLSPFTLL